MSKNNLGILVLDNFKEFGQKVQEHLAKIRNTDENYVINFTASRFSNGEGKITLTDSVREKNLFILSDVGNYELGYNYHGQKHILSPDEHFQDIKRAISATCGHASKISVVTPLLYESRQHRRKSRESLDCAIALQELERLGVNNIITFDAHDPNVCNAIPNLSFDNFYPTNTILEQMIKDDHSIFDNALLISPDMGAMERARYYAEIIGCDVGVFYKRRDLSQVVNGKNPVVAHVYMGTDVKDKNVIIVDDMIASGGSVIEVAEELRQKGANKIYITCTFSLFTEGIEKFKNAYDNNLFDGLYTTNLSYIPKDYASFEWFNVVDLSEMVAKVIDKLDRKESVSGFFNGKKDIMQKIQSEAKK